MYWFQLSKEQDAISKLVTELRGMHQTEAVIWEFVNG